MKERVPVIYDKTTFKAAFKSDSLVVVEEEYSITFDMFFDAYDKRVNKDRCKKFWDRMTKTKQILAFTKLYVYERHLAMNTWKTKADPETYLKNEYWKNDWK